MEVHTLSKPDILKTTRSEESRANEDYPPKMHDAASPSNLK